jgi:carboxylate-amine ligase
MTIGEPSFTVGVEEEYLLVDRASRGLAVSPPPEMLAEYERRLQGRVAPEFLQTQTEVGTGL